MKNRKSATSKFLVPLIQKAERKLLLTGTPALARPEEVQYYGLLESTPRVQTSTKAAEYLYVLISLKYCFVLFLE